MNDESGDAGIYVPEPRAWLSTAIRRDGSSMCPFAFRNSFERSPFHVMSTISRQGNVKAVGTAARSRKNLGYS